MATHGRDSKLYIAKAPSAEPPELEEDWLEIDLATEGTFNSQRGTVETTCRKSGGDEEFIPGHRSHSYDFTANLVPEDAAVEALSDNYYADGVVTWFRDRPLGTGVGKPETVFRGFVTNMTVAMPGKDRVTIQATIQVTGKPEAEVQE